MDRKNANAVVKDEWVESAMAGGPSSFGPNEGWETTAPRPMEGLHDQGPPPFLTKTYEAVDDPGTDGIVSWSRTHNSFVVWDPYAFSISILPKYFKHNNFSSFVRQLNTYGFRKVDPDRWEFANEGFLRGQKHLLKTIKRRRPPSHTLPQHQPLGPCLEVGQFGLDGDIDRLKRDKNILMAELVKLRQEQQITRAHLKAMEERLQGTEQRQHQMMAFLARAMRNPNFLRQLVQQKDKRKELEDAISKKRRRPIEQGPGPHCNGGTSGAQFNANAKDMRELYGYEIPELEGLALEMQGIWSEEDRDQPEEMDVELNEEFWEELLNGGIGDEKGGTELDERGCEDVNLSFTSPR